ncbi:MAG: Rho termination factor N-terminal domain-containing protein, partial [Phycisphaerales bacterium]
MAKATTRGARTTKKRSSTSAASKKADKADELVEPADDGEQAVATQTPEFDDTGPIDAETHAKYEQIKKGDIHIRELQRMTVQELHEVAKVEGLTEYTGLKKQDLIFKILKERIKRDGLMYGEGVLEILPDGFGFLRSPEYQ